MEARQSDELELVSQIPQFILELCYLIVIEVLLDRKSVV